jgi:hypothetical protein
MFLLPLILIITERPWFIIGYVPRILWGSALKNAGRRKYKYWWFWQGRVLDIYITDEVTSQEGNCQPKGH